MLWGEQAKLSEQKIQLRFRENYMYTKLSNQAKISNVLLNQYVIFFLQQIQKKVQVNLICSLKSKGTLSHYKNS